MADVASKASTVFGCEALASCWDEALPLMRENYEETGTWMGEFSPDRDKLIRMEEMGFLRVFTSRSHGRLIGYQLFFVMFGINHPKALMATCHVAYVHPAHRGPSAYKFLLYADRQLMLEGVVSIARQSTVYHPLDALYERMKYHRIEETWLKLNPFSVSILHGGASDGGDSIDQYGGA